MANVFDQFDFPSALVGLPQDIGKMGPNTKYTPDQMARLNAARDALLAAEARGDPATYGGEAKALAANPFDQFDAAPVDQTSPFDAALIGAGRGLTQLGRGVQQAYYGATGNAASQAALKAKVDEENRLYAPLQAAHPLATGLGEGLPVVAGGPVTMAAAGALEYGTPEEKAARAAAGFVGGKLGQYGGQLIGRVAQPIRGMGNDAIDATKALLDKYGITGLPGQITGSRPLQWAESVLSNLPGGGRIRNVAASQQSALNSATMDAIGGQGASVTPEAVTAAKNALGAKFNTLPTGVTVQVDDQLLNDLADVETNYMKNLSPDQKGIVKNYLDSILNQGNSMPGDVYQKARSRIGARAASTSDSELQNALTGVKRALDAAFIRSAPEDIAKEMLTTRGQYAGLKSVENMATDSGNISAARLSNAAKNMPPATRELATLGTAMRGLPSSGTAERLFYQSLLSGGIGVGAGLSSGDPTEAMKYGAGSFVAPWVAAQALTRAPLRNYLTNTVVSPMLYNLLGRGGASLGGLLGLARAQ